MFLKHTDNPNGLLTSWSFFFIIAYVRLCSVVPTLKRQQAIENSTASRINREETIFTLNKFHRLVNGVRKMYILVAKFKRYCFTLGCSKIAIAKTEELFIQLVLFWHWITYRFLSHCYRSNIFLYSCNLRRRYSAHFSLRFEISAKFPSLNTLSIAACIKLQLIASFSFIWLYTSASFHELRHMYNKGEHKHFELNWVHKCVVQNF